MKNLQSFLKKLGAKQDIIEKLSSEEEVNVDELAGSFKSVFKEALQNDPDFIQPIKDEIRGTELSKIEHKIKKTFGLSADEVKEKKFDEIIATAYEKVKASGSSTSEELQNKLMELSRENKRLMEEVIPAKESEVKEAIKGYQKEVYLRNYLSSKKLTAKSEVAYLAIQNHISSGYNIEFDEAGKPVLKTKAGLAALNDDGTRTLSLEEFIDKKLMDDDLIPKSNAGASNQPETKTGKMKEFGSEQKFNLPGMKTAQENAEAMKNLRTFGQ